MSNIYRLRSEDERLDEAARWIARMDKGLSASETRGLQRWLSAEKRNHAVLERMAMMWDKSDSLARLSDIIPHHKTSRTVSHGHWLALAASLLLAVSAGMWVLLKDRETVTVSDEIAVYETAIGGMSALQLADGSTITLNTSSHIEVIFSDNERLIDLIRGEMHIDVAHDASRPLSVIAGNRVVRAVGTAFSIKLDESQRIELLVTDGKVQVGVRVAESSVAPADVTPKESGVLSVSQGERVIFDEAKEDLEVLEPEDINVELAWRDGNLIFRGESLSEAAGEISRYTPVEFVFMDEELQTIQVAGYFKAGDVEGFLTQLRTNFDIVYERLESTITLSLSNTTNP